MRSPRTWSLLLKMLLVPAEFMLGAWNRAAIAVTPTTAQSGEGTEHHHGTSAVCPTGLNGHRVLRPFQLERRPATTTSASAVAVILNLHLPEPRGRVATGDRLPSLDPQLLGLHGGPPRISRGEGPL